VAGPPSISANHIEAGKLRAIGVTSPQRVRGALAKQATWREQGIDAVVVNWRGIIGARGLGAPQIAFWDATLGQLARSEEWDRELARNLWENAYTSSAGAAEYMKVQYAELGATLRELGFVK
jgi:putative tricarboxylic transport membrane protein